MINALILFIFQHQIPALVTAASNDAVNVNTKRLLRRLLADGESTEGIYRMGTDDMNKIYSDPDLHEMKDLDDWCFQLAW